MPSQSLVTIINENSVVADSLCHIYPDSVWIANLPEPSFADSAVASWLVMLGAIILTAFITYLWTRKIYEDQKRDALSEKHETAFRLLWAICDEMRRTRDRVWQILENASQDRQMKGPLCTEAKDLLVGRLTELMPAWWEPHHVFRYYELLSLISAHHNAAVAIPAISSRKVSIALAQLRQGDHTGVSDLQRQSAVYSNGLAFARHYFDTSDGDNLTDHYILAVKQLEKLSKEVGVSVDGRLSIPTKEDRISYKILIDNLNNWVSNKPDPED